MERISEGVESPTNPEAGDKHNYLCAGGEDVILEENDKRRMMLILDICMGCVLIVQCVLSVGYLRHGLLPSARGC